MEKVNKKIGVVFDSTCGKTKNEVLADGYGFVSILININGKDYKAGDDISQEELYDFMLNKETVIRTSTPLSKDIINAFENGLKKYDELVFISLSKKFSGTVNSAKVIVENNEKFKNKVHVYDSLYSSPWTSYFYEDIKKIVKNSSDVNEIFEKLDFQNGKLFGWLSPGNIWWFYKGGRITKNQYIAANILKIKPILFIENGEINKNKILKARTNKMTILKMLDEVEEILNKKENKDLSYKILCLKSDDESLTKLTKVEIAKRFNIDENEIVEQSLSMEQYAHMGPNSLGVSLAFDYPFLIKEEVEK